MSMEAMLLEDLRVELQTYGSDKGKYRGRVKFRGDKGAIEVTLLPEHLQPILAIVAESLVATATDVAKAMVQPLIEHQA